MELSDPGEGSGNTLLAFDGNFSDAIETAYKSNTTFSGSGINLFNVRIKDENGNWGPVFKKTFVNGLNNRSAAVTEAEFFWGTSDPGEGSGTPLLSFDNNFNESY